MKETVLVHACTEVLTAFKIFHWRNNSGALKTERGGFMRFGCPGSPDIIAIHDGVFIGIECKVGYNKQSKKQVEFQNNLEKAGGKYLLIYKVDELIKEVKDLI